MKPIHIAIVGATGLVGRTFLQVLEQLELPIGTLKLFASARSKGVTVSFQGQDYLVETIEPGCFTGIAYALFSAGASTSLKVAKQATKEGAIVIDNSSAWRMDPSIPLVVPEINLTDAKDEMLIANPNCSTIQSVLPLYPLHKAFELVQLEYNTYQAVSGAGQQGLDDLARTLQGEKPTYFPYSIADTAIPQIDVFLDNGYTKEEQKMMDETRKILHLPNLPVSATCVRVPVAHSHGVSIRARFRIAPSLDEVRNLITNQPGCQLLDNPKTLEYPTSVHATGKFDVFVGRIRKDMIDDHTILLYVVGDNILKGAAWNAVQIMKELIANDNRR
jgi:aspartate-semialdehyde dehydrogenase